MDRSARRAALGRGVAFLLTLVLATACTVQSAPATRRASPASDIRVPTNLANGRVDIRIRLSYKIGVAADIPVTISVSRGSIRGPVAARVVANGMGGGGVPSEVTVRRVAATPITVGSGGAQTTTVTWDGRDDSGALVPGDAYVLIIDLETNDGTRTALATASATFQWDP